MRRSFWTVAILSGFCIWASHASASDARGLAEGFYDVTPVMKVTAHGEGVVLEKAGQGDAFARWTPAGHGFVPLDDTHDRLTVVFGEMPRSAVQVRIEFPGKGASWQKRIDAAGPVTLESVLAFARQQGKPDADRYRLFFRLLGGEGAKVPVEAVVFGDGPLPEATRNEPEEEDRPDGSLGVSQFYDATDAISVSASGAGVVLEKIAEGDAFVRWGPAGRGFIPLDDRHDQLVIDFGQFARSQVTVAIQFPKNKVWLDRYSHSGVVRLESVRAFASEQGLPDATRYRVFFRIMAGAGARIELNDMRVLSAGAELPESMAARPDAQAALRERQDAERAAAEAEMARLAAMPAVERMSLRIESDTTIQVLDASSETAPRVVVSNPTDTRERVEALLTVTDYDGESFELRRTLEVPAGGEADWALPRDRFDRGFWYVDYALTADGQTRDGRTRLAVVPIPGVGDFDFDGYNYGICWNTDPAGEAWDYSIDMYRVSGADHARMHWKWEAAQPTPDRWEFGYMDRFYQGAREAGIEILHILAYNVPWAVDAEMRQSGDWRFSPPDLGLWSTYVRKMVERYPAIRYWEVWNEPDLTHFWLGDTQEYLDLLEVSYDLIKSNDPSDVVTLGGFALLAPHGGRKHVNLQRDVVLQGRDHYDVWATHKHGTSTNFISQIEGPKAEIQRELLAAGLEDPPIWFTETAIQARPDEWNQAEEMVRKMAYARTTGAMAYTWFQAFDSIRRDGRMRTWGLLSPEKAAKPALVSFNTAVRVLGNRAFERFLDVGEGNYALLFGPAEPGGDDRLIVTWSGDRRADRAVQTLRVPEGARVVAHDVMAREREVEVIEGRVALPIDSRTTLLELRGVGDELQLEQAMLRVAGPIVIYPGQRIEVETTLSNPDDRAREFAIWTDDAEPAGRGQSLSAGQSRELVFDVEAPASDAMRYGDVVERVLHYRLADRWEGALRVPAMVGALIPAGPLDREPDFVLNNNLEREIVNLFNFDPRSNHLVWHGPDDLSAKVWLQLDGDYLRIVVEARDDVHVTPRPIDQAWKDDSVQVGLAIPGTEGRWQWTVATADASSTPTVFVRSAPEGMSAADARVEATVTRVADDKLRYVMSVPLDSLGMSPAVLRSGVRFDVVVNDRDHDVREGWAQLSPSLARGGSSDAFPMVKFE